MQPQDEPVVHSIVELWLDGCEIQEEEVTEGHQMSLVRCTGVIVEDRQPIGIAGRTEGPQLIVVGVFRSPRPHETGVRHQVAVGVEGI